MVGNFLRPATSAVANIVILAPIIVAFALELCYFSFQAPGNGNTESDRDNWTGWVRWVRAPSVGNSLGSHTENQDETEANESPDDLLPQQSIPRSLSDCSQTVVGLIPTLPHAVEQESFLAKTDGKIPEYDDNLSNDSSAGASGTTSPDIWDNPRLDTNTALTTPGLGLGTPSVIEDPKDSPVGLLRASGPIVPFEGTQSVYMLSPTGSKCPLRMDIDTGSNVNVMSRNCQTMNGFKLEPCDQKEILYLGERYEVIGKVTNTKWHFLVGAKTYTNDWYVAEMESFDAMLSHPSQRKHQLLYLDRS